MQFEFEHRSAAFTSLMEVWLGILEVSRCTLSMQDQEGTLGYGDGQTAHDLEPAHSFACLVLRQGPQHVMVALSATQFSVDCRRDRTCSNHGHHALSKTRANAPCWLCLPTSVYPFHQSHQWSCRLGNVVGMGGMKSRIGELVLIPDNHNVGVESCTCTQQSDASMSSPLAATKMTFPERLLVLRSSAWRLPTDDAIFYSPGPSQWGMERPRASYLMPAPRPGRSIFEQGRPTRSAALQTEPAHC
jgi:hypothetical protein